MGPGRDRTHDPRTFCDFNCALFSHPSQGQLVINGRETITCTCTCNCVCALKSVAFSLMSLLNVVRSSFFNCTLYGHYVPFVLVFCLEKQTSFTEACGVPQDLYVKDIILPLNPQPLT